MSATDKEMCSPPQAPDGSREGPVGAPAQEYPATRPSTIGTCHDRRIIITQLANGLEAPSGHRRRLELDGVDAARFGEPMVDRADGDAVPAGMSQLYVLAGPSEPSFLSCGL